jgi:HD-GYP domain-containing protein (c-di-GMP phosphodiesterase class II)
LCDSLARDHETADDRFEELKRNLKFKGTACIHPDRVDQDVDGFYRDNAIFSTDSDQRRLAFLSALHYQREILRNPETPWRVDLRRALRISQSLAACLIRDERATLALTGVRNYSDSHACHAVSVSILTLALGRRLGLHSAALRDTGVCALLHDLGKRGVPPVTLGKSCARTEFDWEQIRNHPWNAVKELARMDTPDRTLLLSMVAAFSHHMNLDGTGYPEVSRPLTPDLVGRMIRIADLYDSLTRLWSPRVKPLPRDEARAFLSARCGVGLDPVLWLLFTEVIDSIPGKVRRKEILAELGLHRPDRRNAGDG